MKIVSILLKYTIGIILLLFLSFTSFGIVYSFWWLLIGEKQHDIELRRWAQEQAFLRIQNDERYFADEYAGRDSLWTSLADPKYPNAWTLEPCIEYSPSHVPKAFLDSLYEANNWKILRDK
jgi:hypothetical protein